MQTRALWRFNESTLSQRPADAVGAVADLFPSMSYPMTAVAAREATARHARFDAGWLCDVLSGSLPAIFGAPTMAASGSPTYGQLGARRYDDLAVGFNSTDDSFAGGDVFDITALDDFVCMFAAEHTATPSGVLISKHEAPGVANWTISLSSGNLSFQIIDGAGSNNMQCVASVPVGKPYGGIVAMSRALGQGVAATAAADGSSVSVSSLVTCNAVNYSNAGAFRFGGTPWLVGPTDARLSCAYIGVGPGKAGAIVTNMAAAIAAWAGTIATLPALVSAAAARGRSFVALSRHGYEGTDVAAGSTLLTRDASVLALVRWDSSDQGGAGLWTLTKTGGSGAAYDAGASSVETFAGDGYVEIVVNSLTTARYFGLSDVDVDATNATIDYAIRYDVTDYTVVENNVTKLVIAGVVAGDVLRVERVGSTVFYKRNGITYYTSLVASAGPLRIDTSFLNVDTTLEGIRLVDGGTRKAITWQNLTNVTPTPSDNIGTLYARGKATSSAEYVAAGVEVRVSNAALRVGELRWLWQDTGGALRRQAGGYFQAPADSGEILLTATRRWVSASKVVLRYYIGDQMLAEIESADGSIGGSASGTTTIGARFDGTKYVDFFDGVIDELEVVDGELSPDDVARVWSRLSKGSKYTRMLKALLPPGKVWR